MNKKALATFAIVGLFAITAYMAYKSLDLLEEIDLTEPWSEEEND